MKNVFEIRTDLALEVNEQVNREKGRLKGVIINEMKDNKTGIKVTVLEITGKEGVKALHRPEGKYITIEAGKLGTTDDEYSTGCYGTDRHGNGGTGAWRGASVKA